MQLLLRQVLLCALFAGIFLTIALWIQGASARPDMAGFDPGEMGRLESAMWRSYYEGRWGQLASQTMEVACRQHGFSWWDGARVSFYAARSALFFRKQTDDPRCLPDLIRYYAIIGKATGTHFDIQKAADLELRWWKERRQNVAPQDYAITIAQLASLVYGVPQESVLASSTMRANAMAYRDARRDGKMTDADWQEISRQLTLACRLLKESLKV